MDLPHQQTGSVTDQYPAWFLTFLQDVIDMRDAQNNYFAQPTNQKLLVAKARERKVDVFTDRAIKAGIATHTVKTIVQQPTLL